VSEHIVEIHQLDFSFNGQPVLQGVELELRKGDFMAMIGPNGGGKTTLLKLILGLLRPDRGVITVLGGEPRQMSHRVGYVPQDIHINKGFPISALDVVRMGRLRPGIGKRRHPGQDRRAAFDSLDRMGMAGHADRRIGDLSGGQIQRVFVARALVTRPELLLLDEPTASIDKQGQQAFYQMLETLNREVTIILVSHDLMAVSTHVKSVACVNRRCHYHDQAELTGEMVDDMYSCPVDLIAHGVPHRVLKEH
jgi:zinc transport system ATP-binding protein